MKKIKETISIPKDYTYEYDIQYNTAINKKVFTLAICNKINGIKDLKCYYNPKTDKIVIIDTTRNEKISGYFHEFVSGRSRLDISYEEKYFNYKLKRSVFPDSGIKTRFDIFDVFKTSLVDLASNYKDENKCIKIDFDTLFDANLFAVSKDENSVLRDIYVYNSKTPEEQRAARRSKKNLKFNEFYLFYMQCNPVPENNPFDCLDVIAKYSNCSLGVYYPIGVESKLFNGFTTTLNYSTIPNVTLIDNSNDKVLYKGESIAKLVDTLLEKFNTLAKESSVTKRKMNTAKRINNVFEKMMVLDYSTKQFDKLKKYLEMRAQDEQELKTVEHMSELMKDSKSIINETYDKISNNKVALKNEDVLYEMIDRFDEICEEKGYTDISFIKEVIEEFDKQSKEIEEKNEVNEMENNMKDIDLILE